MEVETQVYQTPCLAWQATTVLTLPSKQLLVISTARASAYRVDTTACVGVAGAEGMLIHRDAAHGHIADFNQVFHASRPSGGFTQDAIRSSHSAALAKLSDLKAIIEVYYLCQQMIKQITREAPQERP